MDQGPVAVDSSRQQRGILIFGRHDHTESSKAPEVLCERQGHPRTTARKRSVRNRILLEFGNIGDAWIFDAPDFLRVFLGIRHQRWLGIDTPSVDSILRTCRAQVRQATPVFHAAKQQGISACKLYGTCVEDAVDRIGPVFPPEDRIAGITREQRAIDAGLQLRLFQSNGFRRFSVRDG